VLAFAELPDAHNPRRGRHDRSAFVAMLAALLDDKRSERRLSMMCCDSAYGAPYVERLLDCG
jgi:hypothetical protein